MSATKIYLDLPDELQQLLSENHVSVGDLLRQENIEAEINYGTILGQTEEGARSKDVVTIILASSAAVLAIGVAISRVLQTLNRKPHLVQVDELTELRDAQGNVLLDAHGKPQYKRVKRYELLEPRKEDASASFEVSNKPDQGFVLKFSTAEKQLDTPSHPDSARG
jgi:hypothetical protein